jgi:hypothetical protein
MTQANRRCQQRGTRKLSPQATRNYEALRRQYDGTRRRFPGAGMKGFFK